VSRPDESSRRFPAPPPQENLSRAAQLAFEALKGQTDEQLLWLGAERASDVWRLPVLNETFEVDLSARRLTTPTGEEVGPHWTILALHYLAVTSRPERLIPEVTFADLETARSYAGVYHGRVIARLCATVGRDTETLTAAARALGGCPIEGGDAAFDFRVFPRLSLRLIWHAPDEEFPPSATLLLPPNIEDYLCAEDIVVLSERLVSRLSGRPF
jgi:hypothetical protein